MLRALKLDNHGLYPSIILYDLSLGPEVFSPGGSTWQTVVIIKVIASLASQYTFEFFRGKQGPGLRDSMLTISG